MEFNLVYTSILYHLKRFWIYSRYMHMRPASLWLLRCRSFLAWCKLPWYSHCSSGGYCSCLTHFWQILPSVLCQIPRRWGRLCFHLEEHEKDWMNHFYIPIARSRYLAASSNSPFFPNLPDLVLMWFFSLAFCLKKFWIWFFSKLRESTAFYKIKVRSK